MESVFQPVNKLIEASLKKNWDRPALSNYQGTTLSYGDLAFRIAAMHVVFERCGLQKGDKVAICARNHANWAVCLLSSMTYGAVAVPLLHEFKPGNIHYLVNHSESKVLFVDSVVWEGLVPEEMPEIQVVVKIDPFEIVYARTPEQEYVKGHILELFGQKYPSHFGPDLLDFYTDSADELALISYTSGTSGFSKGVMIPYRSIWSNVYFASLAEPGVKAGDEVVAMLPSAHMFGMMFELMYEMVVGCHVYFLTRLPSPKVIMKALGEIHPCMVICVPLIFEKIYKSKLKPIIDKNKIFFRIPGLNKALEKKIKDELYQTLGGNFEETILGGAAFNPEVEQFLYEIGFPYTVGYGMTECGPIITYAHHDKVKPLSCGKVAPNMEIRIDSSDPQKIPGEVQVKGMNVFLGYYKNEEATANSFTDDGWLRTGDMGVIDEDGYLFLRGRSKCMILGASGQNIYPEELEGVINTLREVIDSLVIDDHGTLTALIYPDWQQAAQEGMSVEQFQDKLLSHLPEINKMLPSYAQIKKIEFMPEDFERTPKKSIKRYLYQR